MYLLTIIVPTLVSDEASIEENRVFDCLTERVRGSTWGFNWVMCGIVDNGNGAGTIVSPDCSLI